MLTILTDQVYITYLHNRRTNVCQVSTIIISTLLCRHLTAHFCQVFTTSRAAAKQLAFPARTLKQLARTAANLYILGP